MAANSRHRKLALHVGLAFLSGVAATVGLFGLCFIFAGYGEGTIVPFGIFFAPVLIVCAALDNSRDLLFLLFLSWIALLWLYPLYAMSLVVARFLGKGRVVAFTMIAVHVVSCGIVYLISRSKADWDDPSSLLSLAYQFGMLWNVILVETLVTLPTFALQYASSATPYRPRLTRSVIVALSAGIVGGVLLYSYSVSVGRTW